MNLINEIDGVEPEKDSTYCLIGVASIEHATEQELDMWATDNLTNRQWELEYQGLWREDKRRYIKSKLGLQ